MVDGNVLREDDGIALAGLEYCLLAPEELGETNCVTALAGLLYCFRTLGCGSVFSEVSWFSPEKA